MDTKQKSRLAELNSKDNLTDEELEELETLEKQDKAEQRPNS